MFELKEMKKKKKFRFSKYTVDIKDQEFSKFMNPQAQAPQAEKKKGVRNTKNYIFALFFEVG